MNLLHDLKNSEIGTVSELYEFGRDVQRMMSSNASTEKLVYLWSGHYSEI